MSARKARRDTVLPRGGGLDGSSPVLVTKGAYVAYSSYALHRRRDIWGADADSFRPERWLDVAPDSARPEWSFVPFLGGPRACLGQQLAITEVGFVTVRLCQAFSQLNAHDTRPWEEALSFSFYNRHGCHISLQEREP